MGCGGISVTEYKWLSDHEEEPWFCLDCQPIPLLAGDVEGNPRPTKFPCTVCGRVVSSNQQGVECTKCERWMHAGCGGISVTEYK